jgi:serine/threonine-protein kinase
MTPAQIGRYHVVGHLASGGMAEILLGKLIGPSGFERPVVIKRILSNLARQASFVRMFLDEAQVVSRIQHPNVVAVHELGQDGEELFLVMEYLEGESLLSIMRRAGSRNERLDVTLAAHIVAQACAGLHAAHEIKANDGTPLGLVHRDVSPSNIFVTYSGAVKLLDFGIAKFEARSTETEAGTLKGKYPYMSPEQCFGRKLDRRSDVFSLGIVLFETTTGRRLFERESSLLTMKAITEGPIPSPQSIDPDYPIQLAQVCNRALARDPEQRYQTAATMRRDLALAIRELAPAEVPEMALATLMERFFEDRIAQKRELLQRVSAGSEIVHIPAPEVDISVELPTAFSPSQVGAPTPVPASARAHRAGLWALVALGALAGAAFTLALLSAGGDVGEHASAAPPSPVAAAAPTAPAAPPPVVAPQPSPTVALRVESTPPGALVRVAGEDRGRTPLVVELDRAMTPLDVEVVEAGFVDYLTTFVPDEDGRIDARLERANAASLAKARRARPRRPTAPAKQPSGSPFRRFD